MNIRFNETITMPNVTFCMSRAQAWSHFKVNESEASDVWDSVVDVSPPTEVWKPPQILHNSGIIREYDGPRYGIECSLGSSITDGVLRLDSLHKFAREGSKRKRVGTNHIQLEDGATVSWETESHEGRFQIY